MSEQQLQQLRDLLKHEHIRQRKAGVELARRMLADGQHRQQVRALLQEVANYEIIGTVSDPAKAALAKDDARHAAYPPRYAPDKKHIAGANCPDLHPNYYDKRVICPGDERERVRRLGPDGKPRDEIEVVCTTCGKKFKIYVDCEGYKK